MKDLQTRNSLQEIAVRYENKHQKLRQNHQSR